MDFQQSMDELLKAADCPPDDDDKKKSKKGDDDDKGGADASGGDTGDKDNGGDGPPTDDKNNGAGDDQGPPGAQVDGDEDQQMPPEEASGGGDLAGLVDQIADAEQRFYAAKGQHGSGHHEVEVAMEDLHKLVRKLARRVAADSGMGQDDPQMQQGDDQQQQGPPNGEDANSNGDDQGPPQKPKKKGPPEKLQQSLGPIAGELLRKSWPHPQLQLGDADAMMGKQSRSKLNINVKPKGKQPDVKVDTMQAKASQPTAPQSPPLSGKMGHDAPEVSPANYVGDPNGGAFIDWGSQGYAEAHTDGTPSELFGQMTGKGKHPAQGQVPQPPFNAKMDTGYQPGVTGENPYAGSDAGEAHPHYGETKYPGGKDVPTPSAKMGAGSWIDWNGVAESGRSMPFAGEIAKMTASQPAPPAAPQAPQTAPQPPAAAPQSGMSGKMLLRDSIPKMSAKRSVVTPTDSRRGPTVPRKPAPRPAKMARKPANPKQPQRPTGRPVGTRRPPAQPQGQMRGKMHSPVPSTPGQPISATAPEGPVGRMSESGYQTQMSGFDYAMLGRMQRLDAGLPAVEAPQMERSDTSVPTLRKSEAVSFDFLLELSEDFEKADREMRALLGEED